MLNNKTHSEKVLSKEHYQTVEYSTELFKNYKPCPICYPCLKQGNKPIKRTLIKRKYNSKNDIPKSVKDEVLIRSRNKCEVPNCETSNGDYRGLQFCHINHRKMGGRSRLARLIIHDKRNIFRGCGNHHDIVDGRKLSKTKSAKQERLEIIEAIKQKIGWHEWVKEYRVEGNGNIPLNR